MNITVLQNEIPFFEYALPGDEILEGTELFIGRSEDCHIVLDDQKVSRYHAKVIVKSDGIYVKNNSEFGHIEVNGKVVDEVKITEAARVAIDNYVIQFSQVNHGDVQLLKTPEMPVTPKAEVAESVEDLNSLDQETEILDNPEAKYEEFGKPDDENELNQTNSDFDEEDEPASDELDSAEETEEENDSFGDDDDGFSESPSSMFEDHVEESAESVTESEGGEETFAAEGEDGFAEEGFGGEDGFGDGFGGEESDSGGQTQVFQSFAKYFLIIQGDLAPFDRYEIGFDPVHIGRDPEKCQICLPDSEVSGVHAIIKKNLISCVIEDQDSSNGTKLNGERINKAELVNGDIFEIGSTRFLVEIKSDLIEAEKDILMPVDTNQEIEVEEVIEEEVDFDEMGENQEAEEVQEKSLIKRIMKDPKKKRMVMIGGVLLLFALLFGEEEKPIQTEQDKKVAVAKEGEKKDAKPGEADKKDLSPEVIEKLEQNYQLALAKYEVNEFNEAKTYLEIVISIDPNYKNTQTLYKLIKQAMEEIARIKKEEQEEVERKKRQLEVQKLVAKAKEAVKAREVRVAESIFGQILEKDPENIDVPQLKLEIDAYKKEQEEKKLAEEAAKAKRRAMVEALAPGKTLYMKGDWYQAITALEEFASKKDIDEDIMKEGTEMLKDARQKLRNIVDPLIGQARSYKEGQDLKRAYETYGTILKHDPGNEESLNEREEIKNTLDTRSRKLYREALISESLSLFEEAKEKFQEVQQVSPIGSDYYNKATEKLKDYLE